MNFLNTPTPSDLANPQASASDEQVELSAVRALLETNDADTALSRLQQWLMANPFSHQGFALLGETYQITSALTPAVVAFQRALQLKNLAANHQPSEALSRLADLEASARKNE